MITNHYMMFTCNHDIGIFPYSVVTGNHQLGTFPYYVITNRHTKVTGNHLVAPLP